jgi:hypothetical protein
VVASIIYPVCMLHPTTRERINTAAAFHSIIIGCLTSGQTTVHQHSHKVSYASRQFEVHQQSHVSRHHLSQHANTTNYWLQVCTTQHDVPDNLWKAALAGLFALPHHLASPIIKKENKSA